ncbi:MAG: hypothetical protein QOJ84_5627 [Bradyrhizobium sp.]|nr:hypothetical protein [Bradyrhizobium sp.]
MTINHPITSSRTNAAARKPLSRSFAVLALLSLGHAANAQTVLPGDVDKTCVVKEAEFKGWFENGNVVKDGKAKPANSLEFTPNSACSFYRWSEQMFLWLTSPTGAGRYVFNSRNFYAVDGLGGTRTLVPQDDPIQKGFAPAIALKGDKKQDLVTDSAGVTRNVIRLQAPSNASSFFVDKSNKPLDFARVASAVDGKPILLDKFDKVIDPKQSANGAPLLNVVSASGEAVQLADTTVLVDGVQRLVTTQGEVIEIGPGQAGDDVLMTKDGAIVYYLLQVNDVFAYFKTGAANDKFPTPPTQFPVDKKTSDAVTDIAKNAPAPHQRDIADSIALAMELKSSWVDASTLPNNAQGYLTIKATVPVYESTDPDRRKQTGIKTLDLAMVGFHVVGSALNHPEMIWATFEHVNNTPNLQYSYMTGPGTTAVRVADGPGSWLFSQGQPTGVAPQSRMRVEPLTNDIVARPTKTIGPVNVTRINPWGKPSTPDAAGNNTDIISINASVLGQLAAGDTRKNYIMVGATWTDGSPPAPDNQRGSTILANATMETFKQRLNCFGCHSGDASDMLSNLSHIWDMKPLFPKQ